MAIRPPCPLLAIVPGTVVPASLCGQRPSAHTCIDVSIQIIDGHMGWGMRCRRPDAAQRRHYWMAGCRSCVLADAIERSILALGRSATRQSPDVALHRPPKFALLMGAGKPGVPAPSPKPASLAIPDPRIAPSPILPTASRAPGQRHSQSHRPQGVRCVVLPTGLRGKDNRPSPSCPLSLSQIPSTLSPFQLHRKPFLVS
jgi:hypothetical protein